jgi:hypothetical protein
MRDEFIIELWSRIKPLVPAKDRLDAADAVVAVCDEFGVLDELEHHEDLDGELTAAIKTQLGELYDEDDAEYEDY